MKFGLQEQDRAFLEKSLIQPLREAGAHVWVFGSRARGDHRPFSDLDVLVEWSSPNARNSLAAFRELLEESLLPIKVDLVELQDLAHSYRANALRERLEWG